MWRLQHSIFILLALVAASCSSGPQPIDYGNELCHFCKMTISDSRFGSELVTDKGKVYKYDAVECLLKDMASHPEGSTAYVTDFTDPGILIPAATSAYLISREIPSPMGEFISAYGSEEVAIKQQNQFGGERFDWEGLINHFE